MHVRSLQQRGCRNSDPCSPNQIREADRCTRVSTYTKEHEHTQMCAGASQIRSVHGRVTAIWFSLSQRTIGVNAPEKHL